jgi:uncharacterized tellurite resistance protein B-like protein
MKHAMFGSLAAFITNLAHDRRSRIQSENRERLIATTALLIRVATLGGEMSEARRRSLFDVLRSRFGLDDSAISQLIDDAEAANRGAVDLYRFTRQLNETVDDQGRRQIVQMMWELIFADGGVSELESNIIWRAADLLGVSSRQRIELRQNVAAEKVVAAQ